MTGLSQSVGFGESGVTSRVAHRFGSNKLYICLSNKCFKVYPVYSLCTDLRPSQDHRILCMQMVRINLANTLKTTIKIYNTILYYTRFNFTCMTSGAQYGTYKLSLTKQVSDNKATTRYKIKESEGPKIEPTRDQNTKVRRCLHWIDS